MDLATYLETEGVTQTEFAQRLGVTQGMVWQWLNGHRRVAAEQVLPIEGATDGKVSRHELRPDLYPKDDHKPHSRDCATA
jgi:DNA-binding transcriptional regulator YdaS (Cro superfamily)